MGRISRLKSIVLEAAAACAVPASKLTCKAVNATAKPIVGADVRTLDAGGRSSGGPIALTKETMCCAWKVNHTVQPLVRWKFGRPSLRRLRDSSLDTSPC